MFPGVPLPVDEVMKWRSWIEGPIAKDVLEMHLKRQIWREINDMLQANPKVGQVPSAFWDFHKSNYSTAQAIAIRRQADRDSRSRSLALLIEQMRDNADVLTRDYWVGLLGDQLADDLMVGRAHRGFDHLAGTGDHLDAEIPRGDLTTLRSDAKRVSVYVNEHVAHSTAEPTVRELPTYRDLHEAIDRLGEMFKKYALALTGAQWWTLESVIEGDWKAIFRTPWISE
jgi:hypothetical protein